MAQERLVVQSPLGPGDEVLMHGGEQAPDVVLAIGAACRACVQRELPTIVAPAWNTLTRPTDGQMTEAVLP
jgi:hypothetical protein